MLEKPIFWFDSEFVSNDQSNFLDDYANALMGIQNFYGETIITTGSVALIQSSRFEYLFIVNIDTENYDIIKISGHGDEQAVTKIASFEKLKTFEEKDHFTGD